MLAQVKLGLAAVATLLVSHLVSYATLSSAMPMRGNFQVSLLSQHSSPLVTVSQDEDLSLERMQNKVALLLQQVHIGHYFWYIYYTYFCITTKTMYIVCHFFDIPSMERKRPFLSRDLSPRD